MPEFAPYSENIENVILACKALTEEECKKYFDREIVDKGFQPVQMTIVNNADDAMLFHPDGVSLPVCPPEEVAEKCHTSTAGRATAYGVGALFLWPLVIPAVVDGVKSHEANKELDKDFREKNIGHVVINPQTTHNGVIFFSSEYYQDSFTVKLVNKETRQPYEFSVENIGGEYTLGKTTEPIVSVSPEIADPKNPWTGVWKVEGLRYVIGSWNLRQSGKKVVSTDNSQYEIDGSAAGPQFKGKISTGTTTNYKFKINLSSDGQSFKGFVDGPNAVYSGHISGIRQK